MRVGNTPFTAPRERSFAPKNTLGSISGYSRTAGKHWEIIVPHTAETHRVPYSLQLLVQR